MANSRRHPSALAGICLALVAVLSLGACKTSLQSKLNSAKNHRFEKARKALDAIEDARNKLLASSLPAADAKSHGQVYPLFAWRAQVLHRHDEDALKGMAAHFKGTPAQKAATSGENIVRVARVFWSGNSNMERYLRTAASYIASADKKAAASKGDRYFVPDPFLPEAAFDPVFIHLLYAADDVSVRDGKSRLLDLVPASSRSPEAVPFWELAFGISVSGHAADFAGYVTMLCRVKKLAKYCKNVPAEYRYMALDQPYFAWVKKKAQHYLETYHVAVFNTVITRQLAALDKAIQADSKIPPEDPVLPSSVSNRGLSSGLTLTISDAHGVKLLDTQISDRFDGTLPSDLAAKAKAKIEELKNTPGNRVDFERVVLVASKDLLARNIAEIVRDFPAKSVREFDLAGRRRTDGSERRSGVLVRLPPEKESHTTSYAFQGKKRVRCAYLGLAGKPPIGRKAPGSYLVFGKDSVRAAKLSRNPKTHQLDVGNYTLQTKPDDTKKIGAWVDKNPGIIRLFVDGSFSYDRMMQIVSRILYKCSDQELILDDQGKDKLLIHCGHVKTRDVTLVVGICE